MKALWWGVLGLQLLKPEERVSLSPLETQLLPLSDWFLGTDLHYEVSGPATLSPESVLLERATLPQSSESYQHPHLFIYQFESYLALHTTHCMEVWRIGRGFQEKVWAVSVGEEIGGIGQFVELNDPFLFYWSSSSVFHLTLVKLEDWSTFPVTGFQPLPVQVQFSQCSDHSFLLYRLHSFLSHYHLDLTTHTATLFPSIDVSLDNIIDLACHDSVLFLTPAALYSVDFSQLHSMGLTPALGPLLSVTTGSPHIIVRATEGYWVVHSAQYSIPIPSHVSSDIVIKHATNYLLEYEAGSLVLLPINRKSNAVIRVPLQGAVELTVGQAISWGEAPVVVGRDYVRVYEVRVGTAELAVSGEGRVQVCAWEHAHPAEQCCATVTVQVIHSSEILTKQDGLIQPSTISRDLYVYDFNTTAEFLLSSLISGADLSFSLSSPSPTPGLSTHFALHSHPFYTETSTAFPSSLQGMRIGCFKAFSLYLDIVLFHLNQTIYLRCSISNLEILQRINENITYPQVYSCALSESQDIAFFTPEGSVVVWSSQTKNDTTIYPGVKHMLWMENLQVLGTETCVGVEDMWQYVSWRECRESQILRIEARADALVVIRKEEVGLFQRKGNWLIKLHSITMPIDCLDAVYEEPYLVVLTAERRIHVYRVSPSLSVFLLKTTSLPLNCHLTNMLLAGDLLGLHCGDYLRVLDLTASQREMPQYQLAIQRRAVVASDRVLQVLDLQCHSDSCWISRVTYTNPLVSLKLSMSILDPTALSSQVSVSTHLTVSNEVQTLVIPFTVHLHSTLQKPQVNSTWGTPLVVSSPTSLHLYDIFAGPELTFATNSPHLTLSTQLVPRGVCSLLRKFLPLSPFLSIAFSLHNSTLQVALYDFSTSPCTQVYAHRYPVSALDFELGIAVHLLFVYQKHVFFLLAGILRHSTHSFAVCNFSLETLKVERVNSFEARVRNVGLHVVMGKEKVEVWGTRPSLWRMVVTQTNQRFEACLELFTGAIFASIQAMSSYGKGEDQKIYIITDQFVAYEMTLNGTLVCYGPLPFPAQDIWLSGNRLLSLQPTVLQLLSFPALSLLKLLVLPTLQPCLINILVPSATMVSVKCEESLLIMSLLNPQGSEVVGRFESAGLLMADSGLNQMIIRNQTHSNAYWVEDTAVGRIETGDYEGNITLSARNSRGMETVTIQVIREGNWRALWVWAVVLGVGSCCLYRKGRKDSKSKAEVELTPLV